MSLVDPHPFFWRVASLERDREVAKRVGGAVLIQLQRDLIRLGWPLPDSNRSAQVLFDALQCFQEGYGLGDRLAVDRHPGPKTLAAVKASVDSGGYCWPNFRWIEFREGNGAGRGNGWIRVRYELGRGLQTIRTRTGAPIFVVNGQRSIAYNKLIGSTSFPDPRLEDNPTNGNLAPGSRHIWGEAADITTRATQGDAAGLFSGIGVAKYSHAIPSRRRLMHTDVGGMCDHGSSRYKRPGPNRPAIWTYPTR